MSAAGEGHAGRRARARVIYVMGSGHSGSTILGVTLGNCRGMFFAGELQNYLSRSGRPVLGGLERDRLWARVRELAPEAEELYGRRAHSLLERSSAIFGARSCAAARALRPRYRAAARSVLAAIAQASGEEWVIDTSHFPLRARELQRTEGIELFLIFLVRDPQPVVASINRLIRPRERGRRALATLRTNLDLWLTHALALAVFLRQPRARRIFVRYEDFLSSPERVVAEILERSGSDAPLPDFDALRTGLAIHGNRLIEGDLVVLERRGTGVRRERRRSALTAILQRPWEAVFRRLG